MIGKYTTAQEWITGVLLCGALGVSACAPARPPTVALSQAETVEQLRENRASQYALEDLQLAREKLTSARLALDARAYERAQRLADQAVADARLAEVRADTESMRQAARDVRLSSEAVRDTAARLAALY